MGTYILGISCYYHDSAVALLDDGEIISALQEERFTRKKHDSSFPINAIRYCFKSQKIYLKDIECIIYYEKPLLTFERLLETYLGTAPRGVRSFIAAMLVWLKEKLFLKSELKKQFKSLQKELVPNEEPYFPESYFGITLATRCKSYKWLPVRKAKINIIKTNKKTLIIADGDKIYNKKYRYDNCHYSKLGARKLSNEFFISIKN